MATLVHSEKCQTTLGMGLADNSRRRHRGSLEVSVVRDVEVIFDRGLKSLLTVPGHILDREEGSIAYEDVTQAAVTD